MPSATILGFIYTQLFVVPTYPTESFASQTVIITGSNVGLGKEAARHITRLGAAKVILAVRNEAAGAAARRDIVATTGCAAAVVEVWPLDLASYASVQAFAARAAHELGRVDVLVANAGIATLAHATAEGHERTLTVNVISTFLLAFLLLPLQRRGGPGPRRPRTVIVSSDVHAFAAFPEWQSDAGVFAALDAAPMAERYYTSKLLEVLVVRQIAPLWDRAGVVLNALNPGMCHSALARDVGGWGVSLLKLLLARSTEVGSRTLVAAAAASPESHGRYMTDGKVADHALSQFVRSADGDVAAEKVWAELKLILEHVQPGVTQVD